ncbi:hypothetical protein [Xylocopilactobacillus apicola]|uniref:Uncharacterized protein n=1 Tax=Xylocopilactobacillus apicola TaxID=2932184 RepID=A0AAU9DUM6_9LACO|nr:hypothetical protein [Xylocopilactobacillus apicola]BDR59198.1 hypothetical protein XA3_16390 [Xylocopilactobacillus apicola]
MSADQLQARLVTEPYRGMDEDYQRSEKGRIANNDYLTPAQGLGKYIISFVTKKPLQG